MDQAIRSLEIKWNGLAAAFNVPFILIHIQYIIDWTLSDSQCAVPPMSQAQVVVQWSPAAQCPDQTAAIIIIIIIIINPPRTLIN